MTDWKKYRMTFLWVLSGLQSNLNCSVRHVFVCKHATNDTDTYMHTKPKSKAKPTAAVTQLLSPSEPALGCLGPLRHLSLVHAENLPEAGLVTRMRAIQVLWIEIMEPKVPHLPHTIKGDKGSRAFAFPVFTRYQLMLLLGGRFPSRHQATRSPFKQLDRLEQCK